MFDSVTYMRIVCVWDGGTATWAGDERLRDHYDLALSLPDLSDPATRGCVFHLVRELWKSLGATHVWVEASLFSHWAVWFPGALGRDDHATGETEMHALVAALKAGHRAKMAAISTTSDDQRSITEL